MNIFRKLTAPKEVRAAIGVLDEIGCTFHSDSDAFQLVRSEIEKMIFAHQDAFVRVIQKGTPPRQWVWGAVANVAGDHVESGQYHFYRGELNPLGPGEDLLRLFDTAADELVQMGAVQPDYALEQKAAIRRNIKDVG